MDTPDGIYHVASHGLERRRIVRDDTDRAKGRRDNGARRAAIYLCRELTLSSARALGVTFGGVTAQSISKTALQVAQRRRKERRLDRQLAKIEAQLHNKLQVET